MSAPIYLDHNATTPLSPEVADAMRACWLEVGFNAASQHSFGRLARRALEMARERIGQLLGAKTTGLDADHIVFTSGGTEANNLAILGMLRAPTESLAPLATSQSHLVISRIEHPSITALAAELAHQGFQIDWLDVDQRGVVCVSQLPELLRPETRVVAVLLGHNETGVLQPIAELAVICAVRGVPLHTDAAQVAGKLPVDFRSLGVATMGIAAHKFHGPLGIGALVVRHGVKLQAQLFGGFQQAGLRPGTEPVAMAVGMCRALELWHAERQERAERMRRMRDDFERAILAGWPAAVIIGADADRLPHVSNIAFVGLDRQALFMALDQAGVACSTGSACASGSSEPSPALIAMGCDEAVVGGALRFSLGITTTRAEIVEAARRILRCCKDLERQKQR